MYCKLMPPARMSAHAAKRMYVRHAADHTADGTIGGDGYVHLEKRIWFLLQRQTRRDDQ
jgi:hypothetical protein